MPRNMSFARTADQIRARTKTVTRRTGWRDLKAGELFYAVEKARGLKKGQKIKRLALLRCVSNTRVKLSAITYTDVRREGFPELNRSEFVAMFCRHMRCNPSQSLQRIVFEYLVDQAELLTQRRGGAERNRWPKN
jgi:hypothetical protein